MEGVVHDVWTVLNASYPTPPSQGSYPDMKSYMNAVWSITPKPDGTPGDYSDVVAQILQDTATPSAYDLPTDDDGSALFFGVTFYADAAHMPTAGLTPKAIDSAFALNNGDNEPGSKEYAYAFKYYLDSQGLDSDLPNIANAFQFTLTPEQQAAEPDLVDFQNNLKADLVPGAAPSGWPSEDAIEHDARTDWNLFADKV